MSKENVQRIPDNMLLIEVTEKPEGGAKVSILMNPETFEPFERHALRNGIHTEEVFAEAVRLERLFCEAKTDPQKDLILRKGRSLRTLISV